MKLENERLKSENAKYAQCLEQKANFEREHDLKTQETQTIEEDSKEEQDERNAEVQFTDLLHENPDFSMQSSVILNNPKLADSGIKTDELWFNQFESLKDQVCRRFT